jgi:hypothetical protein
MIPTGESWRLGVTSSRMTVISWLGGDMGSHIFSVLYDEGKAVIT